MSCPPPGTQHQTLARSRWSCYGDGSCQTPAEKGKFHKMSFSFIMYTEDSGLGVPVNLCIASPISRQIAIGNAGPASALESMGGKQTFRAIFLILA